MLILCVCSSIVISWSHDRSSMSVQFLLGKEHTMVSANFEDSPRTIRRSFSFRAEVYFISIYRKAGTLCLLSKFQKKKSGPYAIIKYYFLSNMLS
jgi:hypothetical protein